MTDNTTSLEYYDPSIDYLRNWGYMSVVVTITTLQLGICTNIWNSFSFSARSW